MKAMFKVEMKNLLIPIEQHAKKISHFVKGQVGLFERRFSSCRKKILKKLI